MTETSSAARPSPVPRSAPRLPLLAVLCLLALLIAGGYFLNVFGVRDAVRAATGADGVLRCEVHGRVTDCDGKPAPSAWVRCEWRANTEFAQVYEGMFTVMTDAQGRYTGFGQVGAESLAKAERVDVQLSIQAHGEFSETEPSSLHVQNVARRSRCEVDIQLGAPLPTIPVHVVERDGTPVTTLTAAILPAEGERNGARLPFRSHAHYPDGVVILAVPPQPFRVEVRLYGGKRRTVVGPFDPTKLPERIDITLRDE